MDLANWEIQGIPVESFDLSLNGRDIIPLEDINNVSDLGLVSGDLLKVITNQTDATDSNSDANLDVSLSDSSRVQRREAVQENEAAALTDSGTSGSTLVSLNQTSHGSLASTEMICDTSGNVSVNDEDGNAEGGSSHEADSLRTEPMVVRDCFEDKLPHRLRQVWDSNKPQGVTEALSLVLHVMMLETGFLTHTDAKVASSSCHDQKSQINIPVTWNQFGCCRFSYVHQLYEQAQVCHLACVPLGSLLTITGLISHEKSSSFSVQLKPSEYIKKMKDGFSLSNTAKLSRLFKDSVAYLMTRQLRENSGVFPHSGILTLPMEIQIQILSYLDLRSLLNVSETCQSLLGLSQDDTLWRCLCLRDLRVKFSTVTNFHLWKAVYKKQYKADKDRKRAEEEWRRESMERYRHPHFTPYYYPGQYPGANFPGYRGGDYDLYPFGNPFQPHGPPQRNPLGQPSHMQPRHDPIFPDPDLDPMAGPGRGLRDTAFGLGGRHGGNGGRFSSSGRFTFM
ncbi:putative F-box only protein 7 [Apostichopus japonicus]|uniref:Putative F-box only protein 7 n=1 Tax=Stichopus japonicus TaxID=307972 RepID=A0A2G8KZX7_STIJA|nr:putative F-box only protein 7 [Apostichopus japonicus]